MKIKELRIKNGYSQQKISKLLNISQSNYSKYERNEIEPNIETLKKIADFYNVSLDFLCSRPRPYDLPSTATNNQKQAINIILQLNDINSLRAISYCAGLLAGQE